MFEALGQLVGTRLMARDGEIGTVTDLYFDPIGWTVRYLAIDTGDWRENDRWLLVSPSALMSVDWKRNELPSTITKRGVERSSPIEAETPPWPSEKPEALIEVPPVSRQDQAPAPDASGNPHLLCARQAIRYDVEAPDGGIGRILDLLVDGEAWVVCYLVVDSTNGKRHRDLVAPLWIERVAPREKKAYVDVPRTVARASAAPLHVAH